MDLFSIYQIWTTLSGQCILQDSYSKYSCILVHNELLWQSTRSTVSDIQTWSKSILDLAPSLYVLIQYHSFHSLVNLKTPPAQDQKSYNSDPLQSYCHSGCQRVVSNCCRACPICTCQYQVSYYAFNSLACSACSSNFRLASITQNTKPVRSEEYRCFHDCTLLTSCHIFSFVGVSCR